MIQTYIQSFAASPLAPWSLTPPWAITQILPDIIKILLADLDRHDFRIEDNIAVHREATVESGAIVKDLTIINAGCFVAASAYLRGGVWLDRNCTIGPGAELKTSVMFSGSKLAHFNFVGDSILGANVNLEAGSIVANYRNERTNKEIRSRIDGRLAPTGVKKFGALIGDDTRIGANAVIAPGAIISPRQIVPRLALLDQETEPDQAS